MDGNIQRMQIITNLIWKLLERGGTQGISFLVAIILARILLPQDFGLIVLITIFISLGNVLVQSGLGTALIQKKDATKEDFSTVFFINILIAVAFYTLLFFMAPLISNFYNLPELTLILRVLSLILFPFAINSIQNVVLIKNMQFKKVFISSLGAVIVSGLVGITMAINGYGVWALVGQQISSSITSCIVMWFLVKWRPEFIFSFKRLKTLYSFGWKLLVANLLNTSYNEFFSLIIGKKYATEILGYYNRGKQFPTLIVTNIDNAIQTVMLPAYSANQDNIEKVKQMMRRSIITSSFLIFPTMILLAVIAEPFISIILTDKWLPSIPFLQIFCIYYAFQPIQTANLQAINALGRSDLFLKLEVIKKGVGIVLLLIAINFGVYIIAFSAVLTAIISSFINAFPNKKLLNYSYFEQMKDILPSFALSLFMGMVALSVQIFDLDKWFTLIIQILIGIVVYLGSSYFMKLEAFKYLLEIAKGFIKKKNNNDTSL